MKSSKKIYLFILFYFIFVIINFTINIGVNFFLDFFDSLNNYNKRNLKLICRPLFSILFFAISLVFFNKLNFKNIFSRSILMILLLNPVFLEFTKLIDYVVYNITNKQFCYIHYLDVKVSTYFYLYIVSILFLSFYLFNKFHFLFKKAEIKILVLAILIYVFIINIYRLNYF